MSQRKGILIVLDGLGDRPVAELDGRTPLDSAFTPNLDRLAERGLNGLVYPLAPWLAVETHVGCGLLMGLARTDAHKLRRGLVAAAGADLPLQPGDVAVRCNLATVERDGVSDFHVLDRRAGRIRHGVPELTALMDGVRLDDQTTAFVRPSTAHRAAAVLRGPELSADITDTDPGVNTRPNSLPWSRPLVAGDPKARKTADLLNAFVSLSFDRLKDASINVERANRGLPPANVLITRGAGMVFEPQNLVKHLGIATAVVTGEGTVLGLGKMFGFTVITRDSFTGSTTTDLDGKVSATVKALHDHDLVYLHIKGADLCAHDRQPVEKRDFIQRIDDALAPLLDTDVVIGITGDHSTNSNTGRHSGDPVPAILCGPESRRDGVSSFSETDAVSGGLGSLSATALLTAQLDLMNRTHKYRGYEREFFSR